MGEKQKRVLRRGQRCQVASKLKVERWDIRQDSSSHWSSKSSLRGSHLEAAYALGPNLPGDSSDKAIIGLFVKSTPSEGYTYSPRHSRYRLGLSGDNLRRKGWGS